MPAEIELSVRLDQAVPEALLMALDASFARSIIAELFVSNEATERPVIGNAQAKLLALGKTIRGQMLGSNRLKALQLESFATLCLAEWSTSAVPAPPAPIRPQVMAKLRDYIQAHLDQEMTLSDLASIAELSRSYFLHSFKETTGQTPHRYLMECRLQRARDCLRQTDLPIATIAYDCGFASQSHMTDVFRSHLNISPGRYRQAIRS